MSRPSNTEISDSDTDDCEAERDTERFPWYRLQLLATGAIWFLFILATNFSSSRYGDLLFWLTAIPGVLFAVSVYKDSKVLREEYGWPKLWGIQYALIGWYPTANLLLPPLYLISRREVRYCGYPLISIQRLRNCIVEWRELPSKTYDGAGLFVGIGVPTAFLFTGVVPIPGTTSISVVLLILIVVAPLGFYFARRYTSEEKMPLYDYALRDFSVRLVAVLGTLLVAVAMMFLLTIPFAVIGTLTTYIVSDDLATGITQGPVLSILVLPLAVVFVQILRALPWVAAVPYALRELFQKARDRFDSGFSILRQPSPPENESRLIPFSGHAHTDFSMEETVNLQMKGFYGYEPRSISNLSLNRLQSSIKRGIVFLIPGYAVASVSFAFFIYRPTHAEKLAAVFPARGFLTTTLSFVGIPRTLVVAAIEGMGLPPEIISLGFLGLIVPAALMIPGAWHLVLEYEKYCYRFLGRLGDGNHVFSLWAIHLIPLSPIILLYLWYTEDSP